MPAKVKSSYVQNLSSQPMPLNEQAKNQIWVAVDVAIQRGVP
jgi:hypothetical protein